MFNDKYRHVASECLKSSQLKEKPMITIAIPTYKRAKYLEEAIDSAVNQNNYSVKYEIIIVNNDPDDDMKALIFKYQNVGHLSVYRNKENIGMAGNINRCVLLAKGKYVAYLHDDDLLKEDYIQKAQEILKKYDDNCVGSFVINREYLFIKKDITKRSKLKAVIKKCYQLPFLFRYFYRKRVETLTPEKVLLGWNKNYYLAPTCGTLFHRGKMIEMGLFDEELYPAFDYVFFLQLNRKYKVMFVRDKLGVYRWDENASTKSEVKIRTCLIRLKLINRIYQNQKCNDFFRKYREILNYIELNKYTEEEKAEIIQRSQLQVIPQKQYNVLKFKVINYCYRMINNLDY